MIDETTDWKKILNEIQISEVPVELIRCLKATLNDKTTYLFPVSDWTDQGIEIDHIRSTIDTWYDANGDRVLYSDFVINIEKLREVVTAEAQEFLKLFHD